MIRVCSLLVCCLMLAASVFGASAPVHAQAMMGQSVELGSECADCCDLPAEMECADLCHAACAPALLPAPAAASIAALFGVLPPGQQRDCERSSSSPPVPPPR